jgi:hypothetical protein
MIELVGIEGSREYEVAKALRTAFASQWPGIEDTPPEEDCIKIAANTKLSGSQVSDVDIVVAARLNRARFFAVRRPVKEREGSPVSGVKVRVKNFVCVVEVKSQDSSGISISGDEVNVRYQGEWKSATDQNVKQVHALKRYFSNQHLDCFVYRCVALEGLDELPKIAGQVRPDAGAVAGRFTAGEFFSAMAGVYGLDKFRGEYSISSCRPDAIAKVVEAPIFQQLIPTRLDRQRMDRIAARKDVAVEIAGLLGRQRVHIRGHGGTGKTVMMLQAAHEAYERHGRRSLVLTYNVALAADIRRILALLGVPSAGEGGGVEVRTAMSFVYSWLNRLGTTTSGETSAYEEYEADCTDCLDLVLGGAISRGDIDAVIDADEERFNFDAIIVDEAQDWPQAEARLLAALYGGEKISIADGPEQLLRGRPTEWSRTLGSEHHAEERNLSRSLRMKKNLGIFANAIAARAGINWQVDPNNEAAGGKVIILRGAYGEDRELLDQLVREARNAKNELVDFLHCVPASAVRTEDYRKKSNLAGLLEGAGFKTWDAVDEQVRQDFPRPSDVFRILHYESNRGLEGWTTVLDGFDEAIDQRRFWELQRLGEDAEGAADAQRKSRMAAWRWAMISLTRPIDTLVITLRDLESEPSRLLLGVASSNRDFVQVL